MASLHQADNVQKASSPESFYHDYSPINSVDVMKPGSDTTSGGTNKWGAGTETSPSSIDLSANPYPQQVADNSNKGAKIYDWGSINHGNDATPEKTSIRDNHSKPQEWSKDLFASYKQAIAENKPLVVEFSQESCAWCVKLNKDTMNSDQVKYAVQDAVRCRIDPEKDDDAKHNIQQLQRDLGVDRYPTTLVLDVSKNSIQERGRIVGYFEPNEYSKRLNNLMQPEQPIALSQVA